ncbi:MAG: hypothetical protein AB7U20_22035 [Planctomycetaceae bacterium]
MNGLTTPLNIDLQALHDEHCGWLSGFDRRYLSNWKKLFGADNEAAMAEASVRQRLHYLGVTVEPNEDLNSGQKAPDFKCANNGIDFYVEVACIRIKTAENATGVVDDEPGPWRPINLVVFNKCIDKVRQASAVRAPLLVAVGTWHYFAALQFNMRPIVNLLLTGEIKMSWGINIQTGETSDTYLTTNMYPAIFLKPDADQNPSPAREPISGALLCALGMPGITPVVVLNPNAHRPFDPAALPQLEYGSVSVDRGHQRLSVEWSKPGA